MSESNYNFRQALKEMKAIKKAEILLEVDKVLRTTIGKIAERQEFYSDEALNQIIFVQDGCDIDTYIKSMKSMMENIQVDGQFIRVATYKCNNFEDASNLMIVIRSKLREEEFVVEEYIPSNVPGTNGFIVDTKER